MHKIHAKGTTFPRPTVGDDAVRLLFALARASHDQPPALTRRYGLINLYWIAVEELGPERGPGALESVVARGWLRRHPRYPEIGRLTSPGTRALEALRRPVAA